MDIDIIGTLVKNRIRFREILHKSSTFIKLKFFHFIELRGKRK